MPTPPQTITLTPASQPAAPGTITLAAASQPSAPSTITRSAASQPAAPSAISLLPAGTVAATWENVVVLANIVVGDTFTIGSTVYTAAIIDNDPGEFSAVGTDETCRDSLMNEINGAGLAAAHADVIASAGSGARLILTARVAGTSGNSITVASSNETGWSESFEDELSGGGVSYPAAPSTITLSAASQPSAPSTIAKSAASQPSAPSTISLTAASQPSAPSTISLTAASQPAAPGVITPS